MGRKKEFIRDLNVRIYENDFRAIGADKDVAAVIRRFLNEEFLAILAGDREEFYQKNKKVFVSVGLTDEAEEAIRMIREFYGFSTNSEAVRQAIENGLKTS